MRTDIHLKLKCADCGNELEADLERSQKGVTGSSAHNLEASMFIVPCRGCKRKSREPLDLMAEALKRFGQMEA